MFRNTQSGSIGMRNVFEQYRQAENQLTHALFSALQHDRGLLVSFLTEVCGLAATPKASELMISVQQYPLEQQYTETEIEARNLPDAWVFTEEGWALLFEAKITAQLTQKQLDGHKRIAAKRGFDQAKFFTIIGDPTAGKFDGWTQLTWRDIYLWLHGKGQHSGTASWAAIAAEFFEILEANMLDDDRLGSSEITAFTGFFGNEDSYSYLLAKSKLKKAIRELRSDTRLVELLDMDQTAPGRGAITGKAEKQVWDYLSLRSPYNSTVFTKFLHLTLGVKHSTVEAMVTVPNGLATAPKNAIKAMGLGGFKQVAADILARSKGVMEVEPSAKPMMRAIQRRYPSQGSVPFVDGLLEFDLRTAFEGDGPKEQSQWIDALYDAFCNRKSNFQFQVGFEFAHARCHSMSTTQALDLLAKSWLACKPLIDVARGD
jgi:hypothetical protein